MAKLKPSSPLDGFAINANGNANGIKCLYVGGYAIASLATRKGMQKRLNADINRGFHASLPAPTRAVEIANGHIIAAARDQIFICQKTAPKSTSEQLLATAQKHCGTSASITDQSDAWARLEISGKFCAPLMERLCAIDTGGATFPPLSVARTAIDHISTIIMRLPARADHFVLLTPHSSAASLTHSIGAIIKNP